MATAAKAKARSKYQLNKSDMVTNADQVRHEQLDGVQYTVAPCVMVKEQVLNGELLTADEIAHSVPSWNGRPVVVYHPSDGTGNDISANSPDVLKSYQIGWVYNTHFDETSNKLKCEVWIDANKAQELGDRGVEALNAIESGQPLEVSTGYFSDVDDAQGTFDGVQYYGIQHNILPDHLALLPGEVGACSWEDGCGVRANNKKGGKVMKRFKANRAKFDKLHGALSEHEKVTKDNVNAMHIVFNEIGVNDLYNDLQGAIQEQFGFADVYIVDILPASSNVIFEVWNPDGNYKTYQLQYSVDDGDTVSLAPQYIEVQKVMSYQPVKQPAEAGTTTSGAEGATAEGATGTETEATAAAADQDTKGTKDVTSEAATEAGGATGDEDQKDKEDKTTESGSEEAENKAGSNDGSAASDTNPENSEGPDQQKKAATVNADKEKMITDVITNSKGVFNDSHRQVLRKLSMCDLVKLLPNKLAEQYRKNCSGKHAERTNAKSVEEYIATIPDVKARTIIANAYKESQAKRKQQIEKIVANKAFGFKAEDLADVKDCVIERIYNGLIKNSKHDDGGVPKVDYSGLGYQTETQLFDNEEDEDEKYKNGVPLTVNIFEPEKHKK